MTNIIWSFTLLVTTASFTQAYQIYNHGNGIVHRLNVVQDVTLELRRNLNYFKELLAARLTYWPLKRSLVQFENLKSSCPAHKIRFAKMYLYFTAAHKASFLSAYQQPYLINTFQVHRVLKPWDERQATIAYRKRGLRWQSVLLNIGKDAEAQHNADAFLVNHQHAFLQHFILVDQEDLWNSTLQKPCATGGKENQIMGCYLKRPMRN